MWNHWRFPDASGVTILGLGLGVCAGVSAGALLLHPKSFANGYSPLASMS